MTLMLKSLARLLPFAGLLGVLLGDAGPAYADSVSASATAWWGLNNNPCPAGQTSTGDTTASASAECAVDGNLSTASAWVVGGTLASEVLSASAYAFGGSSTFENVYGDASASFTLENLAVVGDNVPGFVEFDFSATGSQFPSWNTEMNADTEVWLAPSYCPEEPYSFPCPVDALVIPTVLVPYTPGEPPFDLTITLSVEAFVAQYPTAPQHVAQVSATMTLESIVVEDQNGNPIPGATVEEGPEPASLLLVTAGALLLAALRVRRRRPITSLFGSTHAN